MHPGDNRLQEGYKRCKKLRKKIHFLKRETHYVFIETYEA